MNVPKLLEWETLHDRFRILKVKLIALEIHNDRNERRVEIFWTK